MNEEIDIILARYFSGETSKKDLKTLDKWLAQSDENDKLFQQMHILYQHAGQNDDSPVFNTEHALSQFKTHIQEKQKNRFKFTISYPLRAAAAITLLVMGVFAFYYFANRPSKITHIVAVEENMEYKLFENTNVSLAQGSEIVYHTKSKNEITLKGKATFAVQPQENNQTQMVVQAGETFIKDIGTIFTVDATDADNSITVEVTEGEVLFYTNTNAGVHVKAGECAIYDVETKQFIVGANNNSPLPAHTAFHFQNTPLSTVIEMINTCYNVNITINDESLNELFLNASFDADECVENILEIISATFGVQVEKKEGVFVIF